MDKNKRQADWLVGYFILTPHLKAMSESLATGLTEFLNPLFCHICSPC